MVNLKRNSPKKVEPETAFFDIIVDFRDLELYFPKPIMVVHNRFFTLFQKKNDKIMSRHFYFEGIKFESNRCSKPYLIYYLVVSADGFSKKL